MEECGDRRTSTARKAEFMNAKPRLLFTMGDVAGIGPEVLAKAWPELCALCEPITIGDVAWMRRAVALVGTGAEVLAVSSPTRAPARAQCIPCVQGTTQKLDAVESGRVS